MFNFSSRTTLHLTEAALECDGVTYSCFFVPAVSTDGMTRTSAYIDVNSINVRATSSTYNHKAGYAFSEDMVDIPLWAE